MYVDAEGIFSAELLRPYIEKIGVTPMVDDKQFKKLLRDAGRNDPVMRQVQDVFFEKRYFQPAMAWADSNGFTLPLSALVIYDSFVHSGSILNFLRKRFPEVPPAKGGDERTWIEQYVDVRQNWLANAENPAIHPTGYPEFYHFQKIPFKIKGLGFATLERKSSKINGLREIGKTRDHAQCFKTEIARDNWDLSQLPINANGVNVSGG